MGTGIGDRIYIIMGFISIVLIFSGFPSIGKCELTPGQLNGTTHTNGIFPQHTLNTDGCVIPNLFYSDLAKDKHTHFPYDMEICPNSENRLLNNNQTHIWVVYNNLHSYSATNDEPFRYELFRCCYKPFQLAVDFDQDEKHKIQYEDCILFNDTIIICHEFVRVFCYYNTSIIYNQSFASVIAKPQEGTNKYLEVLALPAAPRTHSHSQSPISSSFNVIILGMTAISRLNFHRTMPRTKDVLKDKDTVEFFGYNRYADYKNGNVMPALLGKTTKEISENCKLLRTNSTHEKKDCTLIWDRFKRRGYYTALMEDATKSSISSLFDSSPTDYYFNPFIKESEQKDEQNHPVLCTGDKYTYKIMIDYLEQLCKSLQTSKLFGLFWLSSLKTLGFNYPIAMDSDYEILLRSLSESGYLNQTVLFIISDRGSIYGSSKENYLEERLPLLKLVLPPSFRHHYKLAYNNLRRNSQRLVTTFDLHATLMDLVDLAVIRDEEILIRHEKKYAKNRAISLFASISDKRTCSMARLADDQCTCYKKESMTNLSNLTPKYIAELVIPEINRITARYPQCRRLALRRLLKMSKYSAPHMKEHRWMEYLVRVQAYPEGTFDAVLRKDDNWHFVAIINRVDYDGLKSYCVDDPLVKIYCICNPKTVMVRITPLPPKKQ